MAWDGSSTSKMGSSTAELGAPGRSSATRHRVVVVSKEQRVVEVEMNCDPVGWVCFSVTGVTCLFVIYIIIFSEYKLEYPLPLKITKVAAGAMFTLALGNCGIVWSWGINKYVTKSYTVAVFFVNIFHF